ALMYNESVCLCLAQPHVTAHPHTPQPCPLHRQKQPRPRPVIPSVCLALARLAVIAGRNWPTRARPLSRNPPPAPPPRKRSPPWKLFSHLSALSRPSALIRGK